MKKLVTLFLMGGLFFTVPALANGDEKTPEASLEFAQPQNEQGLAARMNKLESIINALPKVSGYVQTGYVWQNENLSNKEKQSTFQLKRMRLFLDGKFAPKFSYRAQFECFSSSKDGRLKSTITVMDIFATAHFFKEFNVRVGQFYVPLGFENYFISPATLETIDFSNICYRMVCRNPITDKSYIDYGRDLGVLVYGDFIKNEEKDFYYLGYTAAFTNGALPNKTDENRAKDFTGSLFVRPIKNMMVLGSYNYGRYAGNDKDNLEQKNIPMNRYFGGIWYNDPEGLDIRTEYARIKSTDGNIEEDGFYALAAYHIGDFLPVFRYDMYRDNKDKVSSFNRNNFLVGLTYEPFARLKLQANYTYTTFTSKAKDYAKDKGASHDPGSLVQVMCMFKF
ncbi:MAG: porin [Marinifilaceae bacterium]